MALILIYYFIFVTFSIVFTVILFKFIEFVFRGILSIFGNLIVTR